MSSAASRPPKSVSESKDAMSNSIQTESKAESKSDLAPGLRKPSGRSLLQPPARPKPPTPPTAITPPTAATEETLKEPEAPQRPGPISLPSEPRQYRAIGLLKGKYITSEEQLNRGDILAEDGTLIDAVLLGRVTSLIKKHIDLGKDHLWVVYPRTLYKDETKDDAETDSEQSDSEESDRSEESDQSEGKTPALHVQIVGVWEPETLNAETMEQPEETRPLSSKEAESLCDQFSIRGEVAKYSEELGEITVNIVQKSKSENTKPKRPFKLLVNGQLNGRATGYFWDLTVERQEGKLILKEGKSIGVVPPKKKPKGQKGGKRRPANKSRGSAGAPKPKPRPKSVAVEPESTESGIADSQS
ncbi:MAG: hypothetical protein WA949_21410 [Phormidesmis sp.]